MATPVETKEILKSWRGEKAELDFSKTFIDHFEFHATTNPEALAIQTEDHKITYGQLSQE